MVGFLGTYWDQEDVEAYGIETATDQLSPVRPRFGSDPDSTSSPLPTQAPARDSEGRQVDPGITVIVQQLGRNNPELHYDHTIDDTPLEDNSDDDIVMTDHVEPVEAVESSAISGDAESSRGSSTSTLKPEPRRSPSPTKREVDANALQEAATAGLQAASEVQQRPDEISEEKRHDSAHDRVPQLPVEKLRSGRNSPSLRLETRRIVPKSEDTIATSPTLSKHVITRADRKDETLPALQPNSPIKEGGASSPTEKLPSIRQLVPRELNNPLGELAEAATQHAHHHSHSFGSATSQSPGMPYNHYQTNPHTSPSSQHAFSAGSPNSGFSDPYGSPNQYSHPAAYYAYRRTSSSTENIPPPPPSLPSASSSGESHGPPSSAADGYSTSHTTPIDLPDATSRPRLPLPVGIPPGTGAMVIHTGFKCDYPGCTSQPFQTQYLLRYRFLITFTLKV